MKKAMPYVGITGPTINFEVTHMSGILSDSQFYNKSHRGMIGYLASLKTLKGKDTSPNQRYPPIRKLEGLIKKAKKSIFTMVHYNSREIDTLADQISEVFEGGGRNIYGGDHCRSLQLNIPFPDQEQVKIIKERFPEMEIVFQASKQVIKSGDENYIANKIAEYGDSLDHVLLDPSGGRGEPFNIDKSLKLYEAIESKNPRLTLGFAGGFTENNVSERLKLLIQSLGTNQFSIDAEGGIRYKHSNAYGDDSYAYGSAFSYIMYADNRISNLV